MSVALPYTAVVPTKDRPEQAAATVLGLLQQSRRPERIVLVDASTPPVALGDEVAEAVRDAGVGLDIVHAPPSTAGQRNRGVEMVETPLTLLLDDDVSIEPAYVQTLVERWERAGLEAFGAIVGVPESFPPQGRLSRIFRQALMLHYQAPGGGATRFRRSRKLRFVPRPRQEVTVPACGAGYGVFRTELLRRHPFDERFPGYAPGEDLDMSTRLAADAPILQMPDVSYLHAWSAEERGSAARWEQRGERETYFRLRHLDGSLLSRLAFGVSIAAEAGVAAMQSARRRDRGCVSGFLRGVRRAVRESREQPT